MLGSGDDMRLPLLHSSTTTESTDLTDEDIRAIHEAFLNKTPQEIEAAKILLKSPTQLRAAAINPDHKFDDLIAQALINTYSGLRRVVATKLHTNEIPQLLTTYQSNARAQYDKVLIASAILPITALVGAFSGIYLGSFDIQRDITAITAGSITSLGSGRCFMYYFRKRSQAGTLETQRLFNITALLEKHAAETNIKTLFNPDRTMPFLGNDT